MQSTKHLPSVGLTEFEFEEYSSSIYPSFHSAPAGKHIGSSLVFIDGSIHDYQNLTSMVGGEQVYILNPSTDGIVQISEILTRYSELSSIHIISHGDAGSLRLGSATLTTETLLNTYQDEVAGWAGVFSTGADILLYGCEAGSGAAGADLLHEISVLTNADIAASTDLTGNEQAGGNWILEAEVGAIETKSLFQAQDVSFFTQVLHEGHFHNDYVVQTDPAFQKEIVLSGLNEPMDMVFLADNRMLFIEKAGRIKIVDPNANNPTPQMYLDMSGRIKGGAEAGLLSIVLDPDFATNNYFYVYYSHLKQGTNDTTEYRITRFTHNGNSASLNSEFIVYRKPGVVRGHHDGGGLSFGPDGKLYLTIGDQEPSRTFDPTYDVSQVQDLSYPYGKILRINKDGTIPADNPYADGPGGNLDEIWATGLRNPYRSGWDIPSNRFFIGDVGGNVQATAFEEINLGQAGANYGWPNVEGFSNAPSLTNPIFAYDHTTATPNGGAVTAGVVYRGNQFPSEYNGSFFFGDYVLGWMRYLKFDASGNVIDANPSTTEIDAFNFDNSAGTVVSIKQAPDGSLYYTSIYGTDFTAGTITRITYNTSNQLPVIQSATSSATNGSAPLSVNFSGLATDADNDSLTYTWLFGNGDSAEGADVSYTYTTQGTYNATLQVSDGQKTVTSSPIRIQVGSAPDAAISTPLNGSLFRAGDIITINATATDDGPLLDSSFSWDIDFIHNAHTHPEDAVTGPSFSFEIPTAGHGYSDFTGYRFELTVTDADGLTDVEIIELFPEKVDLSFNTNVPGGVTFTVDGLPRTGPFVLDQAINFQQTIGVPATVTKNGVTYVFDSWSNGITTPSFLLTVPEANQTYIANYVVSTDPPPNTELPVTAGLVLHLDANNGVATNGTDLITGWADQSGLGNNLTGAGDPRLVTGALNGHNIIHFDGAGDKLERTLGLNGLPTGNTNRTVFMVAKYNNNNTGAGGFTYGKPLSNEAFGLMVDNEGELGVQGWTRKFDLRTNVVGVGTGWLSQSATLNSGIATLYKNGSVIGTKAQTWSTVANQIMVGAELDSSPYLDMEVAAILVYDRALSDTERQQVETFIQQKYFRLPGT